MPPAYHTMPLGKVCAPAGIAAHIIDTSSSSSIILINTMSIKSTGSAILFLLACIAIAIFYIAVSNDNDGSVVGQDDNSSSNLRQLSLIDPKTIIGKSTDTNCNHVLVTSIGGVGSSKFVGRKFNFLCRT